MLLAGTGRDQVHLLVVVTADRGLCGPFNTNVARFARSRIRALEAEGKTVKLIMVGRKGATFLRREFGSRYVAEVTFQGKKRLGSGVVAIVGVGEDGKAGIVVGVTDKPEGRAALALGRARARSRQLPRAQQHVGGRGDPLGRILFRPAVMRARDVQRCRGLGQKGLILPDQDALQPRCAQIET